jgi:prolyl 4-hydroxylase
MVLYESHSVLHGRPFPLKGRFFANVFVHFEPIGPVGTSEDELTGDLPPYVIEGSPEEPHWREANPEGHQLMTRQTFTTGSTEAHRLAASGASIDLTGVLDSQPEVINVRDANGWTALHEAVRKGSFDSVQVLLDRGAEVNARTGQREEGESPLALALRLHGDSAPIVNLLRERGAVAASHQEL